MDREDVYFAGDEGNRREILCYIVRRFVEQRIKPEDSALHGQRITVGGSFHRGLRGESAAAPVIDHHGLAQRTRNTLSDLARHEIAAASGRSGDQAYRLARKLLGTGCNRAESHGEKWEQRDDRT